MYDPIKFITVSLFNRLHVPFTIKVSMALSNMNDFSFGFGVD